MRKMETEVNRGNMGHDDHLSITLTRSEWVHIHTLAACCLLREGKEESPLIKKFGNQIRGEKINPMIFR